MADVAVASQLQQWTFEKPQGTEPERSTSAASSPDLSHREPETLRIDASVANAIKAVSEMDGNQFQDKYLSSEEDLSPTDGNSSDSEYDYDSDVSIHEVKSATFKANRVSISRWDKGLSCDMAVSVSYKSAGRPKVIELQEKTEKTQRSASLAQLPIAAIEKLRKQAQAQTMRHRSLLLSSSSSSSASTTRSNSPAVTATSRRTTMGPNTFLSSRSQLELSESTTSLQSARSLRSASPSGSEYSVSSRPVSSAATFHAPPRSSVYVQRNTMPFPPLTPASPASHAFLNSDPYENSTTNAASPIIKNGPPHRRLRSISQKLSLAKIAITPSTKKWDSRVNAKTGSMPLTPATPFTPRTPMSAPITTETSPMKKIRRNSRILLSRPPTRGATTTPDLPTIHSVDRPPVPQRSKTQMVARGANERAPTLELPPFPDADPTIKTRRIRKRKSLMDLL
ncbi:unnamed protein product [Periconia digitata]|uniref:Uncharacterized protein n=1 Tax=Periconia digitata TaxID=1303443 RepID=A0A9W4XF61_9PLEO|nr:unnamed protein product [Periconia digitata]